MVLSLPFIAIPMINQARAVRLLQTRIGIHRVMKLNDRAILPQIIRHRLRMIVILILPTRPIPLRHHRRRRHHHCLYYTLLLLPRAGFSRDNK